LDTCRKGSKCIFAHKEEDIVKPMCRYGARCKAKAECKFDHPKPEPVTPVKLAPPELTEKAFPAFAAEPVAPLEPTIDYSNLQNEEYLRQPKREAGTLYVDAEDVEEAVNHYNKYDGSGIVKFIFSL